MNTYKLNLPEGFYKKLLDSLYKKRNQLANNSIDEPTCRGSQPLKINYPKQAIPSIENLQLLIETVFWASIKFEEARRSEFVVVYYDFSYGLQGDESLKYPKIIASKFKEPKKFDVSNIVKLSSTVTNGNSGIVVGLNNEKNKEELVILGISFAVATIPLKIKVIDPGELVVGFVLDDSYINQPIARISGSETTFISSPLMNANIWTPLKDFKPNISLTKHWADATIRIVLVILHKMRVLGHGGILILYFEDVKGLEQKGEIQIQHSFTEDPYPNFVNGIQKSMDKAREERGHHRNGYIFNSDEYLKIDNFAENIALLTTVDGAVIIDKGINILGFGVKISIKSTDFKVGSIDSRLGPGQKTEILVEDFGGTRHQSAIRFINNNKKAIAFVVSQDRIITAFVWDKESRRVCAYRHLETYLC